jgi:hypothetical protein
LVFMPPSHMLVSKVTFFQHNVSYGPREDFPFLLSFILMFLIKILVGLKIWETNNFATETWQQASLHDHQWPKFNDLISQTQST